MTTRTSAEGTTTLLGGPPERPRSRLLLAVIAVVVVATGLVVATNQLGGDDGDVATTATHEPSAAPSVTSPFDPQAATKAAVIEAYKRSYEGLLAVGRSTSPDPNDPRLTQYSTGPALIAKQRVLAAHKAKGQVYVGEVELHPTVIDLTADAATVVDCSVDRTALIDGRTGSTIVDAGKSGGLAATAKLKLEGNVWKVTDFTAENRACVPPAA